MTRTVSVDLIKPSPYQPRKEFDIEDLKGSIKKNGILMALTVRKVEDYYELIDGERRWRTAKVLGMKTVPISVMDIPDNLARQLVWKLNVNRKDYTTREKAEFFKKMQNEGMSLRGIAREFEQDHHMIMAYINVFRLPDDYQAMVWDRIIPIRVIRELESLFSNASGERSPLTGQTMPALFEILDRAAREKHFSAEQIKEALKPHLVKLREEAVEKAKEAVEDIDPTAKKPETPDELEKAAKALKLEAKKKREAKLTPEEKAKREEERRQKQAERTRKSREKKKAEIEKIHEEEKAKAKLELMEDPDFIKSIQNTPETPFEKDYLPQEPPITLTPEEQEEFRQRRRDLVQTMKKLSNPKQAETFKNWLAHQQILTIAGSLKCPKCGKEHLFLKWDCCDINIKDAYKLLQKEMETKRIIKKKVERK